jgi:hypothetical protein
MPSVAEIFTVSGVGVGIISGVAGISEVLDVSKVSDVGIFGASVEVDGRGVTALWQAARIKMERRSEMSFFMFFSLSLRGRSCFSPEAISYRLGLLRRERTSLLAMT